MPVACVVDGPVGALTLVSSGVALTRILFEGEALSADVLAGDDAVLEDARGQLAEYFRGTRQHFELPLDGKGTAFEQRVWSALRDVPYGQTWSYGALAKQLGAPKAVRAVGRANGKNPLPIIVPCHRVIGADGSLTGFGGGLPRKAWLLRHEAAVVGGALGPLFHAEP